MADKQTDSTFDKLWDSLPKTETSKGAIKGAGIVDYLSQGAVGAVEGTAGLLDLPVTGLDYLYRSLFVPDDVKKEIPVSAPFSTAAAKYLPEERDDPTRYARTVGSFVAPGGIMGKGLKAAGLMKNMGLGANAAYDTISGLAAQGAEDITGDDVYSPLVAAITAPMIARKGVRAVTRYTPRGAERRAAAILRDVSGEQGVKNVLDSNLDAPFGYQTYAEVAQTPGAANFQVAMSKELGDAGGTALAEDAIKRQAARKKLLVSLGGDVDKEVTASERGLRMRENVSSLYDEEKKAVQKLWDIEELKNERFSPDTVLTDVLTEAQKGQTVLPFGGNTNKILKKISESVSGGEMSLREIQDLRSAINDTLKVMKDPSINEGRVLMMAKDALDKTLESAAGGLSSRSKEAADKIKKAIEGTRKLKSTYEAGVTKGILPNRGLREDLRPELILGRVASETGAKEFMTKFGDNPELVKEFRSGLIDEILDKTDRTAWARLMRKKRGVHKQAFRDDYKAIKTVVKDIQSEDSINQLARQATGRESFTSQGRTATGYIDTKMNKVLKYVVSKGALGGGFVGGAILGNLPLLAGTGVVAGVEYLEKMLAGKTQKIVLQALREPGFAKELLKKTDNTPKLAETLLPYINRAIQAETMGEQKPKTDLIDKVYDQLLREKQQGYSVGRSPSNPTNTQQSTNAKSIKQPWMPHIKPPLNQKNIIPVSGKNQQKSTINLTSLIEGQDPLVRAIIATESNNNPNARSGAGARGLMQIMPFWDDKLGISNAFDPVENINAGIEIYNQELQRFKDPALALAAYNAGSPAVNSAIRKAGSRKWSQVSKYLPKETKNYVPKVLAKYKNFINQETGEA